MKKYGYIRVSSKDQNPDRQLISLLNNNIKRKDIFLDKLSGKDFNRPQYIKLLKKLKKGDLLVIKSMISLFFFFKVTFLSFQTILFIV